MHQGLWWSDHKLAIPDHANLRTEVRELCHDAPWAGHLGRDKTRELVQSAYWWPYIRRDVDSHVRTCHSCQRNKPRRRKPQGYLHPLQIPARRWLSIAVDFVTDLPITENENDAITVFADRLSRYVRFEPVKLKGLTAEKFAHIFRRVIDSEYGTPLYIVSDRDPRFTSAFWKEVCAIVGIKRTMSTAFHPQTNGQVEHVNGTMEEMLRHFVSPMQTDWDEYLDQCQKAYNNSFHPSIGYAPAEMLYGQRLLNPCTAAIVERNPHAAKFVGQWQENCQRATKLLQAAQQRQMTSYNKGRRFVEDNSFLEGEQVLVNTKFIRLLVKNKKDVSEKELRKLKLLPRLIGPLKIQKRVSNSAFRVGLPAHMKVHDVFHVSLIEKYHEGGRNQPPPLPIEFEGETLYEVADILNERLRTRGRRSTTEFLVQWKGFGTEHNTWEPEDNLSTMRWAISEYRGKCGRRTVSLPGV